MLARQFPYMPLKNVLLAEHEHCLAETTHSDTVESTPTVMTKSVSQDSPIVSNTYKAPGSWYDALTDSVSHRDFYC